MQLLEQANQGARCSLRALCNADSGHAIAALTQQQNQLMRAPCSPGQCKTCMIQENPHLEWA